MGIDEARQQRGIAEVDQLRAGRMAHRGTHRRNALAFDENFARRQHPAGVDLEQVRGMQDDGMIAACCAIAAGPAAPSAASRHVAAQSCEYADVAHYYLPRLKFAG